MTSAHASSPLLLLVAAGLALACGKNEECTRARLEGADAWKSVYEQAGKLSLNGGVSFEDLPKDKQAKHTQQLGVVETQSEMVFKSFAYEKITWGTAEPAREKANSAFDAFFNKDRYPTFAGSLKAANAQYDAVRAACGD